MAWNPWASGKYNRESQKLEQIAQENSGASGLSKAQVMADIGSTSIGSTVGEEASKAAKGAGLNAEMSDALGANIANNKQTDAFANEVNRAQKQNEEAIEAQRKKVEEAQEEEAEKQGLGEKVGTGIGTVAGGVLGSVIAPGVGTALGGSVGGGLGSLLGGALGRKLSDERCKYKSKIFDKRLLGEK